MRFDYGIIAQPLCRMNLIAQIQYISSCMKIRIAGLDVYTDEELETMLDGMIKELAMYQVIAYVGSYTFTFSVKAPESCFAMHVIKHRLELMGLPYHKVIANEDWRS